MLIDPCNEVPGPVSDVLEHDGYDDPAEVGQGRLALPVVSHRVRVAMPVESVVLDRNAIAGPGEVEATKIAVAVDDFVLQTSRRGCTSRSAAPRQACAIVHSRARASVREVLRKCGVSGCRHARSR